MERKKGKNKDMEDELVARFKEELGEILLWDANKAYLRCAGLCDDDIGKSIKEIFDENEYKNMRQKFAVYRGVRFDYNYIWQPDAAKNDIFKVQAVAEYPYLSCHGIKLSDESSGDGCSMPLRTEPTGIIIFVREESGYRIEMISDSLADEEPELLHKKKIYYGMDKLCPVLDRCISTGQTILMCSTPFPDSGKLYSIRLSPFTSGGNTSVLAELSPAAHLDRRNKTEKNAEGYMIGMGTICCTVDGKEYFEDVNPFLAQIIENNIISCRQVVQTYPYIGALRQRLARFGMVHFSEEPGYDFLMGAIPVLSGAQVKKMMIFIIPADNQSLIDESYLSLLTPREENVIRLSTRGLCNKELSEVLNISEGTVKREIFSSCKKLNVKGKLGIMLKLYHIV